MTHHLWITGPHRQDRQAVWEDASPKGVRLVSDCHSRLRGVYTGTNTLLRQLVPLVYEHATELVHSYATEILYVAPELNDLIATEPEVFRPIPVEVYREHRRFLARAYSTVRPLLLAHGLTDFLRECAALPPVLPSLSCSFENVHAADELDRQLLTILVRRVDPGMVTIGVGSADERLPEPLASPLPPHPSTLNRVDFETAFARTGRRRRSSTAGTGRSPRDLGEGVRRLGRHQ